MNNLIKIVFISVICVVFISCSKGNKQVISSYQNGKAKLVYYIKTIDGSKQKTFEQFFYENGKLKYEGPFNENKKTGHWEYYFEDGAIFAKCDYTNSINGNNWSVFLNDKTKIIKNDDKIQEIAFFPDGCPALIKIKKENDEKEYKFFPSFKLMEDRTYIGNILNGKSVSYFENGNINSVHFYRDGIQDSSYVLYYENGTKQITGQYKMGVKIGKWEFFKADGASEGEDVYDINGKVLKARDTGLKYYTEENQDAK